MFQRDVCPDPREGVLGHDAFASRTSVRALTVPHDLLSAREPEHLSLQRHLQVYLERGFRFLKDPQFLASSLYLKKPERIMALLMVMTVCLLVYAALEYRIRRALQEQGATFPDQKGKRIPNPTARWVFHYFVGIHVLYIPGQGLMILNLTDEHQHLLQLLGTRYVWFYR